MNVIIARIGSMKGQWAGHVALTENSKWAKIETEWTPRAGKGEEADPNEDGDMAKRRKLGKLGFI